VLAEQIDPKKYNPRVSLGGHFEKKCPPNIEGAASKRDSPFVYGF